MAVGRATVLQAALYTTIASGLVLVLLGRAEVYFALAERATVDSTLNNTRSALYVRLAQERLQGTLSRERLWDGGNPFELGRMDVKNYAGRVDEPEKLAALPGGVWAYDGMRGEIVYSPSHPRGLRIEGGGSQLRFRLKVPHAAAMPAIEPATRYRWDP